MATRCPYCDETVRAVVTMIPDCHTERELACVDDKAGLHCPICRYFFAGTDEVYLDESSR